MNGYPLTIEWTMTILTLIIFWACAIVFWIKSKGSELKAQKMFFIGLIGFFICWGLMRVFFLVSNIYEGIDLFLYSTYWRIASSIGILALLCILIVMESYLVKSKYIFSIITIIGLILAIFLPLEPEKITGARLATYIFLPAGGISILGLYLYLYIKLTGKARHETGFITTGIALIFLGYLVSIEFVQTFIPLEIINILSPVLMIAGALLFTIIYYRKEQ